MRTDRRAFNIGVFRIVAGATALMATPSHSEAQSVTEAKRIPAPLPPGAQSNFVRLNGIRMHYVSMGRGPLLVLLHGWPQTWFAWHGVMPRLAKRFTVIAPDLRGTGFSESPASGYEKQTVAEDIRALIAHLGSGPAGVIGHDMGGKVAYVLAHLHPEVVSRLVLVDCLIPGTENMDALRGGAWHYGFHMAPDIPEMLTRGREREYIRAQIRAWSRQKDAVSEAAITEFARHYSRPGRMTAGFNYYRVLRADAEFVRSLRGRSLAMPVMTLAGKYGVGEKLAEALRPEASELASFIADDSGHFVVEEAPAFFCDKVETFFAA